MLGDDRERLEYVLDRLVWGTGTILHHPRPTIEAFLEFEFPEDLLDAAGLLGPIPQITMEHKKKILADNYARHMWLQQEGAYHLGLAVGQRLRTRRES